MHLKRLSPILWTKDLQATIQFYGNALGFKANSAFPDFVSLVRDKVELMFVVPVDAPEECKDPNEKAEFFPKPMLTGSIYITMENVDELWEIAKEKAAIKTSLADREYQMRDFSILDNNGYEIVFGANIKTK